MKTTKQFEPTFWKGTVPMYVVDGISLARTLEAKKWKRVNRGGFAKGGAQEGKESPAVDVGFEAFCAMRLKMTWNALVLCDTKEEAAEPLTGVDIFREGLRIDVKNSRHPQRHYLPKHVHDQHTEAQDIDVYVFGHCYQQEFSGDYTAIIAGYCLFDELKEFSFFWEKGKPPCYRIIKPLRPVEELL
jgi:hypothetical protein